MSVVAEGTDERTLNHTLLEHFNPGDKVDLRLSLPRSLDASELQYVADELDSHGVDLRFVQMLSSPYPNTLRIVFARPPRTQGYAIAWMPITAIIAGLGIAGFFAWSTAKFIEAATKNLIPLTLIFVGGGLTLAWIFNRPTPLRS